MYNASDCLAVHESSARSYRQDAFHPFLLDASGLLHRVAMKDGATDTLQTTLPVAATLQYRLLYFNKTMDWSKVLCAERLTGAQNG